MEAVEPENDTNRGGVTLKPIIIIADDLTGACDTGIKFHNVGLKTRVLTSPLAVGPFLPPDVQVISVNTCSRCLPAEQAKKVVGSLLTTLHDREDFYLYKKADSVLRGNVMAEIEGVFETLQPDFVIVASAFPENGRCVQGGVLHICGPQGQEDTLDVLQLFQSQTERRCARIDIEVVRRGAKAVCARARKLFSGGATVLLADAWEQKDLDILAEAVMEMDSRCIPVGSAGLAQSIATRFAAKDAGAQIQENTAWTSTLVVVGTRHPVTLHQLQQLKERMDMKVYVIPARGITQENLPTVVSRVLEAPINPQGRDGILLTTDGIYYGTESCSASLLRNEHNQLILEALGRSVEALVNMQKISGIVATGGDVALEVLNHLHLHWIDLQTEPMPGIVAGNAGGSPGKNFLITMKSGGFGGTDALVKMLQYVGSDRNS